MKANKAQGPSGVSGDLMKCVGRAVIQYLTRVFQKIMDIETCAEEWINSTTLPFFNGKLTHYNAVNTKALGRLGMERRFGTRFCILG